MRTLHHISLLTLMSAALIGCSDGKAETADQKTVHASGQQGERAFPLTGFDSVSLEGPDSVEVSVGSDFSVKAVGDSGLIDALDIKVDGRDLEIGRKGRNGFNWGVGDSNQSVRIRVTMPAIKSAALAGSGDMTVSPIRGARFDGAVAGSGDLTLSGLAVKTASLSIAGSGDLKAAGTAEQVKLSIAGSGDVDGGALTARGADVSIAGSGNARLAVNGPANVSVVGSGDVDLGPKARCQTSKLGSGDVTCGG